MIRPAKRLIIAIDGHSSCGKSTFAMAIAKELGYTYVDSGAMYRAVTWYCMEKNWFKKDEPDLKRLIPELDNLHIEFKWNQRKERNEIYLNNQNIEEAIREPRVAAKVSIISKIPEVRARMVAIQRSLGAGKGIVMDGRDIGTVVFPNADIKIFMTASPEIRAGRRYRELLGKGITTDFDTVLQNVITRDRIDSTRETSPLKKADDALVLDNSNMTPEEQMVWLNKILTQKNTIASE